MSGDPKDLLQRIADGDEDALGAFYRLFEGRIYRFALSRLNDVFDAADILNEVMFEVWRGAARFEGRSAVSSWVLGIAHHKTIDRLRKRTPELRSIISSGIFLGKLMVIPIEIPGNSESVVFPKFNIFSI